MIHVVIRCDSTKNIPDLSLYCRSLSLRPSASASTSRGNSIPIVALEFINENGENILLKDRRQYIKNGSVRQRCLNLYKIVAKVG